MPVSRKRKKKGRKSNSYKTEKKFDIAAAMGRGMLIKRMINMGYSYKLISESMSDVTVKELEHFFGKENKEKEDHYDPPYLSALRIT